MIVQGKKGFCKFCFLVTVIAVFILAYAWGLSATGYTFVSLDKGFEIDSPTVDLMYDDTYYLCDGCLTEDLACLPYGVRVEKVYCDIDGEFSSQRSGGEVCDNNYECTSSLCIDGTCIN